MCNCLNINIINCQTDIEIVSKCFIKFQNSVWQDQTLETIWFLIGRE